MSQNTPAARHSKAYREKKKAKAQAMGTKEIKIEVAAGVEQRLVTIVTERRFGGLVELFQTVALNLVEAAPEVIETMLKRPTASVFKITPKQARQLRAFAEAGGVDEDEE